MAPSTSSLVAAAGVFLALTLSLHAKIERRIEKRFDVADAGVLRVETFSGAIRVEATADARTVTVVATQTIKAETDAQADQLLEKVEVDISQQGSEIKAVAKSKLGSGGFMERARNPVSVSWVITVPARFEADLRTRGGAIEVGNLQGTLEVNTSGGDIRLGQLGGTVVASTSGGSIRLAGHRQRAKLSTSGGDLDVTDSAGGLELTTSGGDILVLAAAGPVNAKTSGGDVDVTFVKPPGGPVSLSTSGGDIEVTFPEGASFDLDAVTSGGRVDARKLPLTATGVQKKGHVEGRVGSGGPQVRLRTSGGDIEVQVGS